MTPGFARLTGPVTLAGRVAQSRVVFGPHETNLGEPGLGGGRAFSPRHVAYYQRRAAGGAGLIVTETVSVHPSDWPYERAPLSSAAVDGWLQIAAACQPHGTLVLAGLGHAGLQGSSAYSQAVLWGPSGVPDPVTREVPMEMGDPEISALTAGFAVAARRAVAAGADGVEIDAGPGALLRQFHIADAGLVAKPRRDRPEQVRPCLLCNQACRVRDPRNPLVSCVGDPRSGHETEDPPDKGRDPRPRDVLVLGGGPAGLEAARVLAGRGHRVRLAERGERTGGALRTAALAPGRERLARLTDWLDAECRRLGVRIDTGTVIGADGLAAARAAGTAVLFATGSRPTGRPGPLDRWTSCPVAWTRCRTARSSWTTRSAARPGWPWPSGWPRAAAP